MRCLLEPNKIRLILLVVFITNVVHVSSELGIEQVAEIVCDSRMASINFKCNLEYGKIDLQTTTQINKYKKVCSKVMKVSREKCRNSAIENCNLATDNMKKFCESKFKEIGNSRLVALKVIESSCQKAFKVTKEVCVSEYLKLVKPKISKIDKFLKLVTTKKQKSLKTTKTPKLTTTKPKISKIKSKKDNENIESVINSIFNENKLNISSNDMETIFYQILSESENYPIKPRLPQKISKVTIKPKIKTENIESMINSIFNANKHKLSKEDMAKFINHVLVGDIHSMTKVTEPPKRIRKNPNKQNKSKYKNLKVSTAAQSLIDFIFGGSQRKIKTNDLLGFIDEVYADAEFDPKKPVKVLNKKPIVIPNNQAVINFIFGKNQNKIHRHLMVSFIERILDTKYGPLQLIKIAPIKPSKSKPKIGKPDKSKGVPFISIPKHKNREHFKPYKVPIDSIKIPLDMQKIIDFIFGNEQNKIEKVEVVNFINYIFSDVDVNQLKPNIGQKPIKIPSVQSVIKFIFGKNPKKIHKQALVALIERIMDIQKMPKKLIIEKLISLQLGKTTQKPKIKIEKLAVSIQSIIDYIFGDYQKKIDKKSLVDFIKEMFENVKFDSKKPVKESKKPHIEMPENEAMINFIFGESQKDIERPVLLDFIDKIINDEQYHSEVITPVKSNKITKPKPTLKPSPISKAKIIKFTKLKPEDNPSFASVIDFIFGESQRKIEKSELVWFINHVFKQETKALTQKKPIEKPKLLSKPTDKNDIKNMLYYIFGKNLEKLTKSDINYCVNRIFGVPKKSKYQASVDNIFNNLKNKIEKQISVLFNDKSYENELYMPLIVDYLLENYLNKIDKSLIKQKLSKLKSKPDFLKTFVNIMISKKPKNINKPVYGVIGLKPKPVYGVIGLKPKPVDKDKQEPFDVSFAFDIISRLLGDKTAPLKPIHSGEINKGNKNVDNKINMVNNSPVLQNSKIKLKTEIHKENPNTNKLILTTIYKTFNKLIGKDSVHLLKMIKDKDRINKVLSSLQINPKILENISENHINLIVSLMIETIDEIFDQLSKHSKSYIKDGSNLGEKPSSIIDDILNPSKNSSRIRQDKPEEDQIISIYDLFGDESKAGKEKEKPTPEKGEIQLKPPGEHKYGENPDSVKNKLQDTHVKPNKDNSKDQLTKTNDKIKKPSKSKPKASETSEETNLSKLKTTVKLLKSNEVTAKPKESVKQKQTTMKPNKSSEKSKKTTAKPNKSTSKSKNTTSKSKKTTAKSKKTTAKAKKTTSKSKKTTSKAKNTTSKSKKTTAKSKKTTAKSKKTTAKSKKTTAKPKKTTAKAKKTTAKSKKTTAKSKKTTAKAKQTTAKSNKTTAKAKKTTAKAKKTTAKAKKTTAKPKKG